MVSVHHIPGDGPLLRSGADALGLLYDDGAADADWIAVPVARLDPSFFDLSSGVAGEFVQKFVNYRARVAVVGDEPHLHAAVALAYEVPERGAGRDLGGDVADEAELTRRLEG